ncbi:MAG: nitronate monooxygenase family protein [Pseudomonadota bacterium]
MRTPLCEKLGIDYPILQAAIGAAACPALAAAVSNAGGLGTLGLTGWGGEGAKQLIDETRGLTNRGFTTNVVLAYDVAAEIDAMLAEKPKLVSFFWGDPAPYVERVHQAGSLLMLTVGSVEEAKAAVDAGVDIIVAQGWEAGGHVRGTVSTLALVPAVVDAIDPVPVVAAGGISDGRGLAAVLSLGAQAAWIGTRFLASAEANTHRAYRAKVLAASTADTHYSALFDGGWPDAPGRVIRTPTVEVWERAGRPERGERVGEGDVIAKDEEGNPVYRFDASTPRREHEGDIEAFPLWAGQGVGLVTREQSAADIVSEIVEQAREVLKAGALLSGTLERPSLDRPTARR